MRNLNLSQQPSFPSYGVRWLTADSATSIAFFGGHGFVDFHGLNQITATSSLDWTTCGALANHYLFTGSNGRLAVTDVWRSPVDVGSISGSHANGIAVTGNIIYAADAIGGLMVYQGFPPPRVRIVYPYADVPVRSGQAIDISWVAENTTNTAWEVYYYNEGSPIKLTGTLSGNPSEWTFHTQLPDAVTTAAGRISVVSADGRIEGSTTIMLEGQMKSSISLAASTATITWPVVLDGYQLLTKTSIDGAWTPVDVPYTPPVDPPYPVFTMSQRSITCSVPASEQMRFFQLRRISP